MNGYEPKLKKGEEIAVLEDLQKEIGRPKNRDITLIETKRYEALSYAIALIKTWKDMIKF